MALVPKVQNIIEQAEQIQLLGLFQRPAAYENLVKSEIVPVLLELAQLHDDFSVAEDAPGMPEVVSVAEVLNEFQQKLKAVIEENQKLRQEITTLKSRVTVLSKTKAPAEQTA